MKTSAIYQIQSKCKPERIYIGSAVNISERWRLHLLELKKNKHNNKKLQNHYNKYGESDLQFSVLAGCEKDDLIDIEQFYIDSKKCWFNICPKAGSMLGYKFTEEQKKKLSESHKGEIFSEERKAKISASLKGKPSLMKDRKRKPFSEETKKRMGKSKRGHKFNLGKHHTEETKDKIRQWHLGRPSSNKGKCVSEEAKQKMKEVWVKRKLNKTA